MRKDSGQALVMMTLALMAMAGMMGLAVDLGWSYFVQKQAQSAADLAALSAVQEAVTRLGGSGAPISAFNCGASGTGATQVLCIDTVTPCNSISQTSNAYNGCQYAAQNGFTNTATQNVTIESGDGTDARRPPGVNRIAYWVRVRTAQTIPQLFSAVLGNTTGLVAAQGTAGIVGSIQPGSFFGMNRRSDCTWGPSGISQQENCGVDIDVGGGSGNLNCGATIAKVCAPAGIILSSDCNGPSSGAGCTDARYAGKIQGQGNVIASSLTIRTGGGVNGGNWPTPTFTSDPRTFQDPTQGKSQPPINFSGTQASCGVNGPITGQLGPYQYYHYTVLDGGNNLPRPDGLPVVVNGNATFSAGGGCPGVVSSAGSPGSGSFPAYVFYGGLSQPTGTATLGPGQYVMAGTTGQYVYQNGGATMTGDSGTGTMFIFTDYTYNGTLATQRNAAIPNMQFMPQLYQGSLFFDTQTNIDLYGVRSSGLAGSNLPASYDTYSGISWWQDRRNSTVKYDTDSGDTGVVLHAPATTTELAANGVRTTTNSPGVVLDHGNANIAVRGVYYQPRGAWLKFDSGTAGFTSNGQQLPLQVITGALICGNGCGDAGLLLAGPTNPIVTYKAALIQ